MCLCPRGRVGHHRLGSPRRPEPQPDLRPRPDLRGHRCSHRPCTGRAALSGPRTPGCPRRADPDGRQHGSRSRASPRPGACAGCPRTGSPDHRRGLRGPHWCPAQPHRLPHRPPARLWGRHAGLCACPRCGRTRSPDPGRGLCPPGGDRHPPDRQRHRSAHRLRPRDRRAPHRLLGRRLRRAAGNRGSASGCQYRRTHHLPASDCSHPCPRARPRAGAAG